MQGRRHDGDKRTSKAHMPSQPRAQPQYSAKQASMATSSTGIYLRLRPLVTTLALTAQLLLYGFSAEIGCSGRLLALPPATFWALQAWHRAGRVGHAVQGNS